MNWSNWIRQFHRWASVVFTVAILVNIVAIGMEVTAVWVYLLALLPLAALQLTGIYLFVLPYAAKWRGGGAEGERVR